MLAFVLVMSSCSDEETKPDNFFKVGEITYPIDGAIVLSYQKPVYGDGFSKTVYRHELVMYNKKIQITRDENNKPVVVGSGDVLTFVLMTPISALGDGKYTWTYDNGTPDIFTFSESSVKQVDEAGYVTTTDFFEGQVSVSKSEDGKYRISIDGVAGYNLGDDGSVGYATRIEFDGTPKTIKYNE